MRSALTAAIYHILNTKGGGGINRLPDLLRTSVVRWPGLNMIRIYDKQPDGSMKRYVIRIEEEINVDVGHHHRHGDSNATVRERGLVRARKVKAG